MLWIVGKSSAIFRCLLVCSAIFALTRCPIRADAKFYLRTKCILVTMVLWVSKKEEKNAK